MIAIPLETERFIIRRYELKDLDAFMQFMLDEESTRYLAFEPEQKTPDGARALFDYVCRAYDSDNPVHSYAIAEKGSDRYIGSCGFAPYDVGIYECYYCINRSDRGQGIATEVTAKLAKSLPETTEVRAYCHPQNQAAHAVARRAGFVSKGRDAHKDFGTESELFIYSRSETESE